MTHTRSDLLGLAFDQFRTSKALCETCGDYHGVWPFLRSFGLVGGIDADREPLTAALRDIADGHDGGPLKTLILGSADTAGVDLVMQALGPRLGSLTLMDRCRTPLAMCAAFVGGRTSFSTIQGDFTQGGFAQGGFAQGGFAQDNSRQGDAKQSLPEREKQGADLIFSHSTIPFLDAQGRASLFRNIAQSLRPGGAVLLAVRLRAADEPELPLPATASAWAHAQAETAHAHFDTVTRMTPDDKALLNDILVPDFYRHMACLRLPYTSAEDLEIELRAAGLTPNGTRLAGAGKAYAAGAATGGVRQGIIVTARRAID